MSSGQKKPNGQWNGTTSGLGWTQFNPNTQGSDYVPTYGTQIQGMIGQNYNNLNNVNAQLPQSLSLNDYYNNPFYQNTYDLNQAPIDRQYQQDQTQLTNQLNAQNQLGSSYDAYTKSLLKQGYDYNTNINALQSRQASANAYQQNLANQMGLGGYYLGQNNDLYNQYFAPYAQYGQPASAQAGQAQATMQNAYNNYNNNKQSGMNTFVNAVGNIGAAAAMASDKRLKEDIQLDQLGLDFVDELTPVTFRYKDIEGYPEGKGIYHGFIAQDLEQVLHKEQTVVKESPTGMKYVELTQLIGPLVNAVQELKARVEELEGQQDG
jgi:hypothetical protein